MEPQLHVISPFFFLYHLSLSYVCLQSLALQVHLVKDGLAVRALLDVLVTLEHQGDRGIKVHRGKPVHQDTVIRTPAWDTMLEVRMFEVMFSLWQTLNLYYLLIDCSFLHFRKEKSQYVLFVWDIKFKITRNYFVHCLRPTCILFWLLFLFACFL